jgi:hypothetical protein
MISGRFFTEMIKPGKYHSIHLQTADDLNNVRQRWKFVKYKDQEFQVFSSKTNYLFDISGYSSQNGRRFFAYADNHSTKDQRFKFTLTGMYEEPKPSNQVVSKEVSQKVGYQIASPNDFFDDGIYCLKNVNSKKVIGVTGTSTNVIQNGDECDTNYRFRIMRIGESDEYRIESITGKGALSVTNLKRNAQPIDLQPYDPENKAQRWRFSYRVETDRLNKELQVRNVASNHTLNIYGRSRKDKAKVNAWVNNHEHPNQRFTIKLVGIYQQPFEIPGYVVKTQYNDKAAASA